MAVHCGSSSVPAVIAASGCRKQHVEAEIGFARALARSAGCWGKR
jgi:hypothetical protein